jgi:hypothetical protein
MADEVWASDVPISMPVPPTLPVLLDFDGFGFTTGGIAHAITNDDVESLVRFSYVPEPSTQSDLPRVN